MIIFAAILVLLSVIALVRSIAHDGYGSRPIPRSHRSDLPCFGVYDR